MKKFGYVRVSAKDQNPQRQIHSLKNIGLQERDIYVDKISGKDFNRPEYQKIMKQIKEGDLIVIKSIDRLGRNYEEILEQWRIITKEKKANIQVIDMPLLNTVSSNDNLTGTFIADLVLQILAYVAETERAFIKQRQEEGIALAKANGVKFGHPKLEDSPELERYYHLWKNHQISTRQAAKILKISHTTFYRRCKELDSGN